MSPRLIDIAQRSGVSEATVSRVLNDRPGVNDRTRTLVLEVARELGRDIATSPATRENLVGVLVPDVDNPVFAQWMERVEAELFERGGEALFAVRARTVERERETFQRFVRAGASGIIVVSGHHSQEQGQMGHYRELAGQGIRLCMINGVRDDLDGTFVSSDDGDAIQQAVRHLQDLGHRTIGLAVGDERTYPVRRKVRAFQDLVDQDASSAREIAFTDFTYAGGHQAARELISRGCTAIVCGSDVMAAGAVEAVRSLGLSVPADVSVVGFDDVPWAALTDPPLTTVRQLVPEMARAAVRAVFDTGSGRDSRRPPRTELEMRTQLVARSSTGTAPRADTGTEGSRE